MGRGEGEGGAGGHGWWAEGVEEVGDGAQR